MPHLNRSAWPVPPSTRRRRPVAAGGTPSFQPLEPRRLMSVSASDLYGTTNVGAVLSYQSSVNGTATNTYTETVVGPATYNGHNALERDEVVTAPGATSTNLARLYDALTGNGDEHYGSVGTVTAGDGTVIHELTETESPPQIMFPPALTAGTTYTNTTAETLVAASSTSPTTTSTLSVTQTVTLASEQLQPITVPAGTYQVYLVTLTSSIPQADGSVANNLDQIWVAPGIGAVKSADQSHVSGASTPTPTEVITDELTGVTGATGTGGSGGGTTPTSTSTLALTAGRSTLATSVIAGVRAHGAVTVSVTNSGTATAHGSDTFSLYATTTGTIDSASTVVGALKRTLTLKAGKSANVAIPVRPVALPAGTYTVLAKVTDASGGTATAATGPALTVAAANIALSAVIGAVTPPAVSTGKTVSFLLTITNAGNVNSMGKASIAVYLSADGTSLTLPVATLNKTLTVKAGGRAVAPQLRVRIPAAAAGGTFHPLVVFTQGTATFTAVAATTVTVG